MPRTENTAPDPALMSFTQLLRFRRDARTRSRTRAAIVGSAQLIFDTAGSLSYVTGQTTRVDGLLRGMGDHVSASTCLTIVTPQELDHVATQQWSDGAPGSDMAEYSSAAHDVIIVPAQVLTPEIVQEVLVRWVLQGPFDRKAPTILHVAVWAWPSERLARRRARRAARAAVQQMAALTNSSAAQYLADQGHATLQLQGAVRKSRARNPDELQLWADADHDAAQEERELLADMQARLTRLRTEGAHTRVIAMLERAVVEMEAAQSEQLADAAQGQAVYTQENGAEDDAGANTELVASAGLEHTEHPFASGRVATADRHGQAAPERADATAYARTLHPPAGTEVDAEDLAAYRSMRPIGVSTRTDKPATDTAEITAAQ